MTDLERWQAMSHEELVTLAATQDDRICQLAGDKAKLTQERDEAVAWAHYWAGVSEKIEHNELVSYRYLVPRLLGEIHGFPIDEFRALE